MTLTYKLDLDVTQESETDTQTHDVKTITPSADMGVKIVYFYYGKSSITPGCC